VLQNEALHHGLSGDSFEDVAIAFNRARANASKNDMIFIGGSTFIVADLLKVF
jgi:dihydrofolate synthase/folylpolyglutamate synthase